MSISEIVSDVGNLAEQIIDTPLYWRSVRTRDGIEAMIQAADAFAKAALPAQRMDAALWLGEAYLIFSRSLPDTGAGEHATGWATANQIAKLLGGPLGWEAKVRSEYTT